MGGVLGEDGEEKFRDERFDIQRKIFCEVQNIIKGFQKKGILLALCSKNNADDVDKVLKSHPDMILQNADFVSKKGKLDQQSDKFETDVIELNLGLESFVFVDDSEFEIGLIRKELPQVQAVLVPKEVSGYPAMIRGLEKDFFIHLQPKKILRRR